MGIIHIDMTVETLRKVDSTETHVTLHKSLGSINDFRAAKPIACSQSVLASRGLPTPLMQWVILPKMFSSLGVQDAHTFLSFLPSHRLLLLGLLCLFLFFSACYIDCPESQSLGPFPLRILSLHWSGP